MSLVEPVGADVGEEIMAVGAEDLRRIIHKAILARRFAAVHKQTARQCLRAARVAAQDGDGELVTTLLRDAREEHAEAQTCTRFARALEQQAAQMGKASGVYRATGRAGPSAVSDEIPTSGDHSAGLSAAPATAGSPATRRILGGSE